MKVNGAKSDGAPVTSGIPQDRVLRPCIFLVFINGLPEATHSLAQIFADGTKLYKLIRSQRDQQQLQENTNSLLDWAHT